MKTKRALISQVKKKRCVRIFHKEGKEQEKEIVIGKETIDRQEEEG